MTGYSLRGLVQAVMARSRYKKHQFFLKVMRPGSEEKILDVGAEYPEYSPVDNYLEKHYAYPKRLTAVTIQERDSLQRLYPAISVVSADGRSLPFADEEFDVVFSNAVIEHVGSLEDQVQFLKELIRVSKRGYITTPNKLFPIETHTRVPLLHWLPKSIFDRFLVLIGKKWATGHYMRLLTCRGLCAVARQAGLKSFRIKRMRLAGFTATIVLFWDKHPAT